MVRGAVLVYLPLAILGLIGWRLVADDDIRSAMVVESRQLIDSVAARPEFAIEDVVVTGGSDALRRRLERDLAWVVGTSSLKLDVEDLRQGIESIGAVRGARVRVDPTGVLQVEVSERIAAALHRTKDGKLVILDSAGAVIGPARRRINYPDLPLVLGDGAGARVGEALDLLAAAPDLETRLRAFVLVGGRRWDIVLGGDLIVMLPEQNPGRALAQVLAWHYAEELLDRDVAAIDMRLPERPVLRMNPGAAEAFRLRETVAGEIGEDT